MKNSVLSLLMFLCLLTGLSSCKDAKPTMYDNSLDFRLVNLSVTGKDQVIAKSSGTIISNTLNVNIIVDGVSSSAIITCKSNELPVNAGDEIELTFYPSCPEETEAFVSLPDGTNRKVTASAPSFKWTVPSNFADGMQIKGESHYETDNCIYISTGVITLVGFN